MKAKKPIVKKTISKKISLQKREWPQDWCDFKNFIFASVIVFFSTILTLVLIVFFTFSLVKLSTNLYLLINVPKNTPAKVESVKDLSDYLYHGEKQVDNSQASSTLEVEKYLLLEEEDIELTLRSVASLDGSQLAVVVKKGDKEAVMLNGQIGPFYEAIGFMFFSPNSLRFAYGVKSNYHEFIVLDGQEGKSYDWIFSPQGFSPDSEYFIYKSRNSNGYFLVFNQDEGDTYDYIYEPFVKDDKSVLIFYARRANQIFKNSLPLKL